MKILKAILYLLLVVVTSMYFFPFEFTFLPGINTKMAMAAVGLIIYAFQLAKGRQGTLDKSFFILSVIACAVSLVAYSAAVINNTNDYTYATYIISMWVWMGGAYVVVYCIRMVHGHASVELVANYLIAVCVLQCGLALIIDSVPFIKVMVNRLVLDIGFVEMDVVNGSGRLYGIGCALDVAGTRFAAVLAIIAFLTTQIKRPASYRQLWLYFASFAIIVVVGNMIARTTIVGVVYAIIIWLVASLNIKSREDAVNYLPILFTILFISVIVSLVLYKVSPEFKHNIRFAFEGFFNLVERGRWETNSNNILRNMIVFPDTLRTWLIGDGYLENPFATDPNYVGQNFHGYYMQTDIGYLRFIFYFGLIGLLTFCFFMVKVAQTLMLRFTKYSWLFLVLLLINFTVWMKVSTDIFLVFAVFLCVAETEDDYDALSISSSDDDIV